MTEEQAQAALRLIYRRLLAFESGGTPYELTLTITHDPATGVPDTVRVEGYSDVRPGRGRRLALVKSGGAD